MRADTTSTCACTGPTATSTANWTAVVVERDGEEYATPGSLPMNHEEEQLSGCGSLLEQRAERRAWQCADDAASVLRAFGAGSGMARELLTEALRHLDTLAKRTTEHSCSSTTWPMTA